VGTSADAGGLSTCLFQRLRKSARGAQLPVLVVWVVTSMRIRPDDLEAFIAASVTVAEKPRRHRRKSS